MMIRVVGTAIAAATIVSVVALPGSASAAAPKPAVRHSLRSGATLTQGQQLTSPNGRYVAKIDSSGRFIVERGSTVVWHTARARGTHPVLKLRPTGDLTLRGGSRALWASNTAGSGATVLLLGNGGLLTMRSAGGRVWSSDRGNLCQGGGTGQRVDINLTTQFAKLCDGSQQLLTTPITSGATALGDGTPTGTWHLQAKVRNTTLYPAAGGAYPVKFWMPYDGAYGMHDSPWQNFRYGSDKYRTQGSHGCVHFPHAAIAWMFAWAPIGTTVHIHN